MDVQDTVKTAFDLVNILFDETKPNEQKLAEVTAIYIPLVEKLDDVGVEQLPAGWRPLVKLLVDNPVVDGFEVSLAKLLAEQTVQVAKAIRGK
jgi:hypothetical protein